MAIEPKPRWENEREVVRQAFESRDAIIKQLTDAVIHLNSRLEQLENAYMEDKLLGKTIINEENQQGQEGRMEDQAVQSSISPVETLSKTKS